MTISYFIHSGFASPTLCLYRPANLFFAVVAGLNDSMTGGMQLLPDPLFSIPTDNIYILSITSTDLGRIFMAGKDGCLYEIAYQAEAGWLSQRCRKINHSKSSLSFLIPSVLQFSFSEDGNDKLVETPLLLISAI